jgi:antitoxin ParD1/3/4
MVVRKAICISITPELDRFVAAQVASGRYQTASEVFRAGLRSLERGEGSTPSGRQKPPRRKRSAEPGRA